MRARICATRVLPLALAALIPLASLSQGAPIRIPDEPSCATCRITVGAELRFAQPEEQYARPMRLVEDSRKRLWLIREQAPPMLFDVTGRFLQVLGKKGAGPDEYSWVDQVYFTGDTAVVSDLGNGRTAILGPSLKASRYVAGREQLINPTVVSWPGQVLASVNGYSRDTTPYIKLVSLAGDRPEVIRFFGRSTPVTSPRSAPCASLHLTRPAGGAFWAASPGCAYDLIEFRLDGAQARMLERRPAWYDRTTRSIGFGGPERAPEATIAGIEHDADGLLWVFLYRPLPGWKEGWARVKPGAGEVSMSQIDLDKIVALRIEVIDPATSRVIARQDFDGFVSGTLSGRRGMFIESSPAGDERIVVREFRLTGR